jgi:hypothetical protein
MRIARVLEKQQELWPWLLSAYPVGRSVGCILKSQDEVERREQELRDKLISVVHCDIRQDPPIQNTVERLYDIVSRRLCLGTARESVEKYREGMRKLASLVRTAWWINCRVRHMISTCIWLEMWSSLLFFSPEMTPSGCLMPVSLSYLIYLYDWGISGNLWWKRISGVFYQEGLKWPNP